MAAFNPPDVSLQPNIPFSIRDLPEDMEILKKALHSALRKAPPVSPTPAPGRAGRRILNLACGRADETGVLAEVFDPKAAPLEIVGADIREPEIAEAELRWKPNPGSHIHTRFHAGDGERFLDSLSSREQFDLAFLRHQNFWNDPKLWSRMFDGALHQLSDDGLFVITSYFDKEHELACKKLAELGAVKIADHRNPLSRKLADAPGKSIDRHIAVFRRPPSS